MAIFLFACKEMATRVKKLLIWMVQLVLPMVPFQREFNGE